ncbi:B12-binding domain-containing radical SAM protein [Azospirillum agricola]|uniref:B12-binding domain-containing radical SAM protein n=1 Tax=Azospirillum agricola TaxID=1720247 RepID=UPI000A0F2E5A|nr:radical SAM protein [Azospirillum agricola]SMH28510.1 Radical SAM superfamily enzyme YgiQ, UPF0313 family [Azospirillum lipoferum]
MRVGIVPAIYFHSNSRFTQPRVPFECLEVAGVARAHGIGVTITDFNNRQASIRCQDDDALFPGLPLDGQFYGRASAVLAETGADLFIFPVTIHTSGTLFHSLKIAESLRERTDAPIVFCGVAPSAVDESLLRRYPCVDVVIKGEIEATLDYLLELAAAGTVLDRTALAAVPGLAYRGVGGFARTPERPLIADLDTLPLPAFDLYGDVIRAITALSRTRPHLSVEEHTHVEAGRGCPFSCNFCANPGLWRRRYRVKSPHRCVEEILYCARNFGADKFVLHHQLFTGNKRWTAAFCEALTAAGLAVEWSCFTRADCVDEPLLGMMAAAGCNTILYGMESASDAMQASTGKRLKRTDAARNILATSACGIKPHMSYIVGLPGETMSDLEESFREYLHYDQMAGFDSQIGFLSPVSGSSIQETHQAALRYDGLSTTTWYNRFFDSVSEAELIGAPDVFPSNFYLESGVPREVYRSLKFFEFTASYFPATVRRLMEHGHFATVERTHSAAMAWLSGRVGDAELLQGLLHWRTELRDIIVHVFGFVSFLAEEEGEAAPFLKDLARYEHLCAQASIWTMEQDLEEIANGAPAADAEARLDILRPHFFAYPVDQAAVAPEPLPDRRPTRITLARAPQGRLSMAVERDGETLIRDVHRLHQVEF